MYREVIQHQKLSLSSFIGLLVLLLVGASVASFLCAAVARTTGWHWLDIVPIAFVAVAAYLIYRKHVLSYRYTMGDDELILEQMTGNSPRIQLRIHTNHIVSLQLVERDARVRLTEERMMIRSILKPVYHLCYLDGKQEKNVLFQPDKTLVEMLEAAIAPKEGAFQTP